MACERHFDAWTQAREHPAMALSFLYGEFCRVLHLIRLIKSQ